MRVQAAAADRRRVAAPGGGVAGAKRFWRWGAPFATGKALGRRARARELNGADVGAAATAQGAAGRSTVSAQLRRPRYGDAELPDDNKRHHRVPYLAAKPRATSLVTARRRTGGSRWRR
jgi:hypothetical protein